MHPDVRRFVALLVSTARGLVTAPFGWRARRWLLAIGAVIAVAGAYGQKRALQAALEGGGGHGFVPSLARFANVVGGGWGLTLLGVTLLAVGVGLRRARVVDAAFVLGASGMVCWVLIVTGQFVFAESRPIEGGAMHWFAANGHGVSGHASAGALLLGPVRVLTVGARRPLRVSASSAAIGWALVVGWSRVWLGMHFLWNVALGLLLGWAAAGAAFRAWRRELPVPH